MKIGDEVYVHGYVDEIRNDVVIIRNDGGYFGTVPSEILYYEEDERGYGTMNPADTPQTDYPTEWCEHCELWREDNCIGVAQCKQNIKALKELSDLYEADIPQTEQTERIPFDPLVEMDIKRAVEERLRQTERSE